MSIEIQCMKEKLIVITIKLDYLKVPSKSTVPPLFRSLQEKMLVMKLSFGKEADVSKSLRLGG